MAKVTLHTGPGVFEVLAHVCRSPSEALKQFVENAADAIEQAKTDEGQIRIKLTYKPILNGLGAHALERITVEDNGVGINPEKMKQVLQQIGSSEKLHLALRGEQGIGLLAFALIAEELHLASSAKEGEPSSCLVLKRQWLKNGHAEIITHCKAHEHTHRGTIAYLEGILPEIAIQLSKDRIKEYLGQQFASDLRTNMYAMSISDNHEFELIHPQRFRGVKVMSTNLHVPKAGSAYIELYVLPWEMSDAAINLYGRGGTRICSLKDLQDFNALPWIDQRLEGYIRYDHLARTADKTAVVQDEIFRAFVNELRQQESKIKKMIEDVSAESQEQRFNIILGRAGKLIDKFVRYKEQGLLEKMAMGTTAGAAAKLDNREEKARPTESPSEPKALRPVLHHPTRAPHIKLQSPANANSNYRSWYDQKEGVICINREHYEFLLSQREDRRCMRYLFYIWVKESLLQEFGTQAEKVADEMVGVLAEAEPLLR
jgi:hypothetical protein